MVKIGISGRKTKVAPSGGNLTLKRRNRFQEGGGG